MGAQKRFSLALDVGPDSSIECSTTERLDPSEIEAGTSSLVGDVAVGASTAPVDSISDCSPDSDVWILFSTISGIVDRVTSRGSTGAERNVIDQMSEKLFLNREQASVIERGP